MTVRDFLELYDKESAVWVYDDATEKCLYDSEEDNYVDEKVLQIAIQGIEEGVSGGVCIKVNTKNLPEYNTRKFLENFRNEFNNQIRPCITEATLKNWMKLLRLQGKLPSMEVISISLELVTLTGL